MLETLSLFLGIWLLFLLLAGYNLQIPYQHVLAILSLLLLAGLFRPFIAGSRNVTRPNTGYRLPATDP